MKRIVSFILLAAAAILAAACRSKEVAPAEPYTPTGACAEGPAWLFLQEGPLTLSTRVEAAPGEALLQIVTDRSLMADEPEVVLSQTVTIGPDSLLTASLGALEAGFYEVRLRDSVRFNIGVRPEQVVSEPDTPEDFDAFWTSTLSELAEVPLEVEWTPVPAYSNEIRQCYEVRYPSWGGAVAGGIVSIPVAEGQYPVHIQYMGYGADPFYFDPSAAPERIDFLVSVRGQGIFKEPEGRWIDRGLASKETFYYRGAFADVRRAVDFAASLEKADLSRMVAYGESQGGAFTVVSAALDPRIRAIAPAVPFLGDYPDYARIVFWPVHEVLEAADEEGISHEDIFAMLRYFDVKNFAPQVRCPAIMAFGLQDPTCPPHTNFAIYNNLGSSEKQFWCVPTCGHAMWLEPSWPPVRDAFFSSFFLSL